jgi:hypothetical protein
MDELVSSAGDGLFDSALFLAIVDALVQAIKHDSFVIEIDDRNRLHSMRELTEWYARQDEIDREPPIQMTLWQGAKLVSLVETEWWAKVGGPPIYHDSYTISFYTFGSRVSEFRQICERVCQAIGANITAFHEGNPRKEPFIPLWKRLLRWAGMKVW